MNEVFFNKNKFIGPKTITKKCGRGGKGSKVLNTLSLSTQSQCLITVECEHGQREVRWNRRYQLCKKCAISAGVFNTSPKGRNITWGDKISAAKKGIKATEAHKKALSIAQYGIEEEDWSGFYHKSEIAKIRDSIEYREFRTLVLQRDNFTCQLTGKRGNLTVHHIVGVSSDPSRILDSTNAITLHEDVHLAFHSYFSNKKNTLDQFNEFKELLLKGEIEY